MRLIYLINNAAITRYFYAYNPVFPGHESIYTLWKNSYTYKIFTSLDSVVGITIDNVLSECFTVLF